MDSPDEGMPSVKGVITEDEELFLDLATQYSLAHPTMHAGVPCEGIDMPGGISRGDHWKRQSGTLQDYVYTQHNSFMVSKNTRQLYFLFKTLQVMVIFVYLHFVIECIVSFYML